MAILLSSCIGTRYLSQGESIIVKESKIEKIDSEFREDLELLDTQKPNKRLFGILPVAHQVHAYQLGLKKFDPEVYQERIEKTERKYSVKIEKAKKEKRKSRLLTKQRQKTDKLLLKKEQGNWLMRYGEKLAVYKQSNEDLSVQRMNKYLHNKGHLQGTVRASTIRRSERKLYMKYEFDKGPRYSIDSVSIDIQNNRLRKLFSDNSQNSLINEGEYYDQSNLEQERERIYSLAIDNGYYTFSKQYISFLVDTTTLDGHSMILTTQVLNPNEGEHRQYKIDSILFSMGPGLGSANLDRWSFTEYNGVNYHFGDSRYNPKVLDWRLFIEKDSLFSRSKTLQTQRQLSYLDAFRFVNVNYDTTSTSGLTASIFTRPMKKFETTNEFGLVSRFQRPGPFLNLGVKIRNAFGGLEVLQLGGNFALLGINSVVDDEQGRNYSQRLFNAQMLTTFPQFLFPTPREFKRRIGAFNPKTQLKLGFNYEDRVGEYTRNTIETSLAYTWGAKENLKYVLTPFNGSYIDVQQIEDDFNEFLSDQDSLGNGALRAAFNSSFISSASFEIQINNNQYGSFRKNSSFLRVFLESGGNYLNFFGDEALGSDSTFSIFQWLKIQTDFRRLHVVDSKTGIAFRFNFGVAHPYREGNKALPYNTRFYIGGSNSMRAWPVRRLGPGAFSEIRAINDENGLAEMTYQLEQGGDIIIESSIEYRKNLVGFVDYALFLDIGNIWILGSDAKVPDIQGDDGSFKFNSFWREFAVGTGIGLRFDFSFLIFRLDWAMQVIDPAQERGERFVLDNINIFSPFNRNDSEQSFFNNKTNLNIGIGFPF